MLPLLVTTIETTPVFNSVALGCRYISPSSTVTARTACVATCVGADTEVGAAAVVLASSNAVRSSRLSSNSVDATSTKVTTTVMAMVLNSVSCDGSVDFICRSSITYRREKSPLVSRLPEPNQSVRLGVVWDTRTGQHVVAVVLEPSSDEVPPLRVPLHQEDRPALGHFPPFGHSSSHGKRIKQLLSRSADLDVPGSRPPAVVLDVGEGDRGVLADQRIAAARVALEREVVEPARLAEHVELLGEVGTFTPGTSSFPLAGADIPSTAGALLEFHPLRHVGLLMSPWSQRSPLGQGRVAPSRQAPRPGKAAVSGLDLDEGASHNGSSL